MDLNWIKVVLSGALGVIAFLIGDFDMVFKALLAVVVIDFVTGILKAIHNKELNSEIMFKGGIKKIGIFLIVAVANIIDNSLGLGLALRGLVIGYYIVNECLSMIENWAALGLPCPKPLKSALEQLRDKEE